ncbi:hypothetical protein PHYSODRAFT_302672 [Phytophthora sojae]|uniref:RxLR effector protein n=1 Tax=Phytophthora sojae (strain P6497) TaxID=1094619 RepID=G4ZSR7_PHYSP|nr:hypothetical protein PHYSODRAFT_302672 [Phytophthora sojae]EGZ12788.1 hypothetical protein PHYSODRAFT_302672 [Phytophthora sojae]|eukprot:XP_009530217.1 hypothetical protein PHYSODRAFT_302672 [Phytophthora sojae]
MIKKLPRLWKILAMAVLALWGLADGPDLVSSKMVTSSQQSFREAKAKQDADRRAAEIQRQQILANTAAKFDERQRTYSNYDSTYSWNRRYRSSTNVLNSN